MSNTNSPMPPAHEREQALFILAAAKAPPERAAFLDRECGRDTELRARLETLLAAHDQPEAAIDAPIAGGRPTIRVGLSAAVPDENLGQKVGHYKILEKIGEGGCGAVYMAQQEEPVRRRVAFKIIKLGMDTRQVVARFEAERQALALMDHPNIARVLDAGATDKGRPFFVMELVKGIPVTRYCDENKLNTEQRLGLFVQICRAVQHAHQKGIIHRDLKPSNILVADHDGVPVPKVIDFGIAKATADQQLTDKTLFTALEQFIGTPAYMSPEQAKLSGLDVDTRSDIYSLGVLLYELLTSKTPFDARRLLEAGFDEIRRIIREEEPPRPSTRLSTLDAAEQTDVAKRRHLELPKLVHLVRGDLDWIVMKALEKDRARRYETANGLALDVQRYLRNEPIAARPPSNLYKLQKLVRRNRRAFVSAAAILALSLGVVLLAWPRLKERVKAHLARVALEHLVLRPPPWVDGEVMQYDFKVAGATVGSSQFAVNKAVETNGLSLWRLTKDSPGLLGHSLVEARADNFKPIHSRYEVGPSTAGPEQVVDTVYAKDHAEIKSPEKAEVTKVVLNGPVFDNDQYFQLVRRLPLKSGYKMGLPLLSPAGFIAMWELEVAGTETVTVGAGTFECFKLKPFCGQTYWYSADPHHYLVKLEAPGFVEELSAVIEPKPIVLQPAPWVDGEEMRFDVKVAGGTVGTIRYTARAAETNGQSIWRLMTTTSRDLGGPTLTLVEAQANTFRPLHARMEFRGNIFETTYGSDHAQVRTSSKTEPWQVPLDGQMYAYEQFHQLVRLLPLEPGYKAALRVMVAGSSSVELQQVEVAGVEEVTVPMGSIKCFRLKPFGGDAAVGIVQETCWYSADPKHYLVKFQNKYSTIELSSVR